MVRLVSMVCLTFAAATTSLHGQRGDVRYGPWATVGAGPGIAGISCKSCPDGSNRGISGFVEVGGTPSERITVGINGSAWTQLGSDTTRNILSILALLYFYPSVEQQSWFVKIGGGGTRYSESSDVLRLTSNGFAFAAGAGYEITGPGHLHFAPSLNVMLSPSQRAKRNLIAVDERITTWTLNAALSVTWRR